MKLPIYDPAVSTRSRSETFSVQPQRPNSIFDSISSISADIGNYFAERDRDILQAEIFALDTEARTKITQKSDEIAEKIKSGGSYANAEKEFSEYYDKVKGAALGGISDPAIRTRAEASYNAIAAQSALNLKSQISTRKRQEAAAAIESRAASLERSYIEAATPEARQAIIAELGEAVAGGEAVGAIVRGEGKNRLRQKVAGFEKTRLALVSQESPSMALQQLEVNKHILDPSDYVQMRGGLINMIEREQSLSSSIKRISDYNSGSSAKPPSQKDRDTVFNETILPNAQNMDPAEYEVAIVNFARDTGGVPTVVSQQASTLLNMRPDQITPAEIASTALMARAVTAIQTDMNIPSSIGFDKDTVQTAALINTRMMAGMDEKTAVTSVLRAKADPISDKIADTARTDAIKLVMDSTAGVNKFVGLDTDIPSPDLNSEFVETYVAQRMMGASDGDAKKNAKDIIGSLWGEFNGQPVRLPPQMVTPFSKEQWDGVARRRVSEIVPMGDDDQIILGADRQTMQELRVLQNGGGKVAGRTVETIYDVSYPAVINSAGVSIPVYDKQGKLVRVFADPKMVDKKEELQEQNDPLSIELFGRKTMVK